MELYVDQNSLHWIYFVKNTYNQAYVCGCKYAKKIAVKDVPMNNYELQNMEACSCITMVMFWTRWCTQPLLVGCKYWVVSLTSTRVSGYSQFILLWSPPKLKGHSLLLVSIHCSPPVFNTDYEFRAQSKLAPSQWETALLCNAGRKPRISPRVAGNGPW